MQKIENKEEEAFDTTDAMISSVINTEVYSAVCPGDIAIDEKTPWFWVLIGAVISIAIEVLGSILEIANNTTLDIVAALIIWPFIIYAFIKGFRRRPDVMVIAKDTIWLITGVAFNRKHRKFSYTMIYQICKTEIQKKFCLFRTIRFNVPKMLKVRLVQRKKQLKKAKKYYTNKVVSAREAKKILFKKSNI